MAWVKHCTAPLPNITQICLFIFSPFSVLSLLTNPFYLFYSLSLLCCIIYLQITCQPSITSKHRHILQESGPFLKMINMYVHTDHLLDSEGAESPAPTQQLTPKKHRRNRICGQSHYTVTGISCRVGMGVCFQTVVADH